MKASHTDGPRSPAAPSIWCADVDTPHRKPCGNRGIGFACIGFAGIGYARIGFAGIASSVAMRGSSVPPVREVNARARGRCYAPSFSTREISARCSSVSRGSAAYTVFPSTVSW